MKKYELLKDSPWAKKGTIYELNEYGYYHPRDSETRQILVTRCDLLNPEWFKLVDERYKPENNQYYCYLTNDGSIQGQYWYDTEQDNRRWNFGNCFKEGKGTYFNLQVSNALLELHKELADKD